MSTDKFNIHEMGTGNDTHSNFLRRMGYGNLLNRPGRQEITLDTASMYKKASMYKNAEDDEGTRSSFGPGSALGAGIGILAGGIGGAELAESMPEATATSKLLGALIGSSVGGVGGYYAGKLLDIGDENNVSIADANLHAVNTLGGSLLGGLAGYGTSRYLLGSKNKTYNLIGALVGAGVGGGAGYVAAGSAKRSKYIKDGIAKAKARGYTGDKAQEFARFYANKMSDNERKAKGDGYWSRMTEWDTNRGIWSNLFYQAERNAEDSADNMVNGDPDIEWNWVKTTAGTAGLGAGGFALRPIRNAIHRNRGQRVLENGKWVSKGDFQFNYENALKAVRNATDSTDAAKELDKLNTMAQTLHKDPSKVKGILSRFNVSDLRELKRIVESAEGAGSFARKYRHLDDALEALEKSKRWVRGLNRAVTFTRKVF